MSQATLGDIDIPKPRGVRGQALSFTTIAKWEVSDLTAYFHALCTAPAL
jgi:hypothetical protein